MSHMTDYQRSGIIAFIILGISVAIALYHSNTSSDNAQKALNVSESNRYYNCVMANRAIEQLNLQGSIQKNTLSLAEEAAKQRASEGSEAAALRAKKYASLNAKLHASAALECVKPKK